MMTAKPPPPSPITRIGLIHTVSSLSRLFGELAGSLLPGVSLIELTDETLLRDAIAAGGLTPAIQQRLTRHVDALAMQGADAVMVTCSSLGPAVDTLAATSPLPLLRVEHRHGGSGRSSRTPRRCTGHAADHDEPDH